MANDTKTALLNAAEHVVRRKGYDGFSYADLAASVGIRNASIHYHFPTKADLSLALMQRYLAGFETLCAAIEADHQTAARRLGALIDHYRDSTQDGRCLCLCLSLSGTRDALSEDVCRVTTAFRDIVADWITGAFVLALEDRTIAAPVDPAREAAATLAVLEGAQLAARAEQDPAAYDRAVDLLRARLRDAA